MELTPSWVNLCFCTRIWLRRVRRRELSAREDRALWMMIDKENEARSEAEMTTVPRNWSAQPRSSSDDKNVSPSQKASAQLSSHKRSLEGGYPSLPLG